MNSDNYFGSAYTIDKNDPRQQAWSKQRERRGFDDTELWNLDLTIIGVILPRLKAFRNIGAYGTPMGIPSKEHWNIILDRIIEGFELYNGHFKNIEECKRNERKFNIAMKLFSKWFGALWS